MPVKGSFSGDPDSTEWDDRVDAIIERSGATAGTSQRVRNTAMWRRVEIWYRTFLSCILLWPFCLVFALATGEYLILVLPGALTALLFIYRPPVYWRDYLPRLGRLVDSIRAKKE